jgi:iron(III) transport system ATP-binding protein
MSGSSVELRSLGKSLGGRAVLRDVSLHVAAGEAVALIGPSGAGKTTLLRLVAGLERPDAGAVLLDGRDAASVAPRDRRVGMVFQDLALWPSLTVEEHLREVARGPVETLIARFGLKGMEPKRPAELSGGERQRLAVARAAAGDPRVLLLDEPFSHLDPLLRRRLSETLFGLQRERGLTALYVTHFFDAPVASASRVALLREGQVEQVGTLSELRANPKNEWVAAFLAEEEVRT